MQIVGDRADGGVSCERDFGDGGVNVDRDGIRGLDIAVVKEDDVREVEFFGNGLLLGFGEGVVVGGGDANNGDRVTSIGI